MAHAVLYFIRDYVKRGRAGHALWNRHGSLPRVEMILQAYGACLTIGYAMNAAVRGINLDDIQVELEGEIDLPGTTLFFR